MLLRAIILLLTLTPALITTARSMAALLPRDQIAFSRGRARHGDLYLLDVRTGIEHALTRTADRSETAPVWAADGKQLAFLASSTDGEQPYVLDLARTHAPLPLDDAAAFYPVRMVDAAYGSTVTLVDLHRPIQSAGRERIELRSYNSDVAFQPSYTPDRRAVIYVGVDQRYSPGILRRLDLSSGHITTLTPRGYTFQFPAWSPDGRWVAAQHERGYQQSDLVLLEAACLPGCVDAMQIVAASIGGSSYPDWSPDARRLVFTCPPMRALCIYDRARAVLTAVTRPPAGTADIEAAWRPYD